MREGTTESNRRRSVGRPVPTRPRCARAAREGRSVGRSDPKAFLDALRAAVGRSAGPSRKRGGSESRVGRSETLRHLSTSHRPLAQRSFVTLYKASPVDTLANHKYALYPYLVHEWPADQLCYHRAADQLRNPRTLHMWCLPWLCGWLARARR